MAQTKHVFFKARACEMHLPEVTGRAIRTMDVGQEEMPHRLREMTLNDSMVCRFSKLLPCHLESLKRNVIFMKQKAGKRTKTASRG